jgi:hypothetical protein
VLLEKDGEDQLDDRVKYEVFHRVKEKRNIVETIKRRNASRIGHVLHKNCHIKHVTEGKI